MKIRSTVKNLASGYQEDKPHLEDSMAAQKNYLMSATAGGFYPQHL